MREGLDSLVEVCSATGGFDTLELSVGELLDVAVHGVLRILLVEKVWAKVGIMYDGSKEKGYLQRRLLFSEPLLWLVTGTLVVIV